MRRLAAACLILVGVSLLVFVAVRLIPGDPAAVLAGADTTSEQIEQIRRDLGLDRPIWVQYARYVRRALEGDLGRSIHSRQPVAEEILGRFPATLELTLASLVIASIVGIGVGVLSAVRQYSLLDHVTMVGALAGISMPVFLIGILLVWFFSLYLGWLPTGGRPECWACADRVIHLILPTLTLAGISVGMIARLTRATMLEVIREDFNRTARAKGLGEWSVIWRHALRNALIPVVTFLGLQFGVLLGGAVVTETIFSWPGMGRLVVDAIGSRDYPVIQGTVLFMAVLFVLINLAVDLLYGVLDPRVRAAR
ncbi:MAG TPA: ABC transporter permease [Thermodesulfobacteriota bacterium]